MISIIIFSIEILILANDLSKPCVGSVEHSVCQMQPPIFDYYLAQIVIISSLLVYERFSTFVNHVCKSRRAQKNTSELFAMRFCFSKNHPRTGQIFLSIRENIVHASATLLGNLPAKLIQFLHGSIIQAVCLIWGHLLCSRNCFQKINGVESLLILICNIYYLGLVTERISFV